MQVSPLSKRSKEFWIFNSLELNFTFSESESMDASQDSRSFVNSSHPSNRSGLSLNLLPTPNRTPNKTPRSRVKDVASDIESEGGVGLDERLREH